MTNVLSRPNDNINQQWWLQYCWMTHVSLSQTQQKIKLRQPISLEAVAAFKPNGMQCTALHCSFCNPFPLHDSCSAPGLAKDSTPLLPDLWVDPGDMSLTLYYMDPQT